MRLVVEVLDRLQAGLAKPIVEQLPAAPHLYSGTLVALELLLLLVAFTAQGLVAVGVVLPELLAQVD